MRSNIKAIEIQCFKNVKLRGPIVKCLKRCFSVCKYKGKTYTLGKRFKDGCNYCQCRVSGVKCSKYCKGMKPTGVWYK